MYPCRGGRGRRHRYGGKRVRGRIRGAAPARSGRQSASALPLVGIDHCAWRSARRGECARVDILEALRPGRWRCRAAGLAGDPLLQGLDVHAQVDHRSRGGETLHDCRGCRSRCRRSRRRVPRGVRRAAPPPRSSRRYGDPRRPRSPAACACSRAGWRDPCPCNSRPRSLARITPTVLLPTPGMPMRLIGAEGVLGRLHSACSGWPLSRHYRACCQGPSKPTARGAGAPERARVRALRAA
jgi:hypothetical protein